MESSQETSPAPQPEVEVRTPKKRRGPGIAFLVLGAFGVLAIGFALIVPNLISARARGQHIACHSNLKNIGTALEMYSTDWSGHYPPDLSLLTPNYLKTIPECPSAGSETYSASYMKGPSAYGNEEREEFFFHIHCHGLNHEPVDYPRNRPAYNPVTGLILD